VTKWVLIIFISQDLWIPMLAYDTEQKCIETLSQWEIVPPMYGMCLPGVIEEERRERRRK
jgi:hypothetical protein